MVAGSNPVAPTIHLRHVPRRRLLSRPGRCARIRALLTPAGQYATVHVRDTESQAPPAAKQSELLALGCGRGNVLGYDVVLVAHPATTVAAIIRVVAITFVMFGLL